MGGSGRDYSDELAFVVDEEVRKLLDDAHAEAYWVLNKNRDILDHFVETVGAGNLQSPRVGGYFCQRA